MATPARYTQSQIAVHWIIVLLVVVQFLSGNGMERAFEALLADPAAERRGVIFVHAIIGSSILAFMIWRIRMRLRDGAPPPPETEPTALQYVSRGVHFAFYALLIAIPLGGIVALVVPSAAIGEVHKLAARVLFVLALLHVAGAAWHLIKGDGVVQRIVNRGPRAS